MSDMNETKKLLRSLLISAEHGVALKDLSRDFFDTVGYPLPYKKLGYVSLEDLLEDIPDTVRTSRDYTGQIRLFGVANQDTKHIAEMVKMQKKGTFNPYKPPPKAQGVQQVQRGGKRKPHYNSYHTPRQGHPRMHARSYTIPHNNYEVDSLSSSSYPDISKPRQGSSYYKGPPAFRANNQHTKSVNFAKPQPQPPPPQQYFNDYNYQNKPPPYLPLGGNVSKPGNLSPNKNSHMLHGTKDAIYDLLSQHPQGIHGKNIEEEYYKIYRTKLPYYPLGHRTVKELIESIPDVVRIDYSTNEPVCFLAHRQEKQPLKSNYINTDWKDGFGPESLRPLENVKSNRNPTPEPKFDRVENIKLVQEDDSISFVLTEEEKQRHLSELRTRIYIFLMSKGSAVPLDEFEHQYRLLNPDDPEIAYHLLGHLTLKEFLRSQNDILVFRLESPDGVMSIGVKTKEPTPPSPRQLRSHVNTHVRPRLPPSNMIRPNPTSQPTGYRTTLPNSGFMPPGAPPPNMRPQRRAPNNNPNIPRFPYHPRPPLPENHGFMNLREPNIHIPSFKQDPSRFEPIPPPSIIPISPLSDSLMIRPFSLDLVSDMSTISLGGDDIVPLKPFKTSNTIINTLNLDYCNAQRDFVQTQIISIAEIRSEVKLKLTCEPVLRFLEGSNVVLLAGEDQGKCALMAVALTNGINMLTDNLQSLVICHDAKGVRKLFDCLETISDNTGLRVSSCDSPEKLKSFHMEPHIIVISHSLLSEFLAKYDTSRLTRIGIYNLVTDVNTYYEFIHILKLKLSGQLNELRFFFATNPHNEAGAYILKLINTLMVSKCIFSYYGKDQETCLTLLPHDVESSQIQKETEAVIRPRLLASLTSIRRFPNHFDKFLIPLGSSNHNFTILSNHMEEVLLQQSLALIALKKVEPSSRMTQVAIVVPNEQHANDFLELCEIGQSEGIKSLMVNGRAIKDEMRYAHICIGWPKEIAHIADNTRFLSKLTLAILFRVDLEQKFEYLEDLFRNCQSPQIVVVGSNYSRQILKFESMYMSEPKHITFLAKDTY